MPRIKTQATTANNNQLKRFVESARALECDESEERFDTALRKIGAYKPPPKDSETGAPKAKAKPSKETG
jgi:hypothetical protein